MARITSIETSLMNQAIAGSSLTPDSGTFAVVNDPENWPMTFFIGTDGSLAVARRGESGHLMTISLSKRFGLSGRVGTLAASQETRGKKRIFLAFTSKRSDGVDALYLVKPVTPDFDWLNATSDHLCAGDALPMSVQRIYMPPNVRNLFGATEFPTMYVSYVSPARPTQDVCLVDSSVSPWRFIDPERFGNFQMPCNPENVIAMHAISFKKLHGLAILYREIGDKSSRLSFVTMQSNGQNLMVFSQPHIDGASSLASYVDSNGDMALLVGGKRLFVITPEELMRGRGAEYTEISSDEAFQSPNQMMVAQAATSISVWFLCNGVLRYQQFDILDTTLDEQDRQDAEEDGEERKLPKPLQARYDSIPLLSCAKSTSFAATWVSGVQRLFVLEGDELNMLMQDEKSELWKTEPFYIPSLHEYKNVDSYTTVISMAPDKDKIDERPTLLFQSDTQSNFIINGELRLVGAQGIHVKCDDTGRVTIILPVDDLGAPIYTITPSGGSSQKVDPMAGPNEKLGKFQTGDDLSRARGASDTAIFSGDGKSLGDAATSLQELRKRRTDIQNGKIEPAPPPPEPEVKPRPWSFFKWFGAQLKKAATWAIKKVGEAVHFIITLAGKAISFVVNTVTQVAKALSSVLETIGAGLKKLIDLLGQLFNPDDYVDMQRLLCNVANQIMYSAWSSIDTVNEEVDKHLELIRHTAKQKMNAESMPQFLRDAKITPKRYGLGLAADALNLINSPMGRWGNYQTDHGGKAVSGGGTDEVGAIIANLINNAERLAKDIASAISGLTKAVIELLKRDEFSIAEAIASLGSTGIDGMISVLKSVINLFLRFFSDVAAKMAIAMNKTLSIPVLSPLFKITFKKDLTLLDAVMFIVAIPLTLVFKLVTAGKMKLAEVPGLGPLLKSNAAWEVLQEVWERKKDVKGTAMDSIPASGPVPSLPQKAVMHSSMASDMSNFLKDFGTAWYDILKPLIPILAPTISILLFDFYIAPKWLKKGKGGWSFTGVGGSVLKIILFFIGIPQHEDPAERWHRRAIYHLGAIRTVTGLLTLEAGGIVTAVSAQIQVWGLVSVQIASAKRNNGSYAPELAIREWLSLLATLSHGAGAIIHAAGEPVSEVVALGVATALTHGSGAYQLITGIREFDGNYYDRARMNKFVKAVDIRG